MAADSHHEGCEAMAGRTSHTGYSRADDVMLYVTKSEGAARHVFNAVSRYARIREVRSEQSLRELEQVRQGRRYQLGTLLNWPAVADVTDRTSTYEFLGVERVWRYFQTRDARCSGMFTTKGLVCRPRQGRIPRYKALPRRRSGVHRRRHRWHDIAPIVSQAKERLGYPTQKPRSLLERIIEASSNEGDVVLDPFCGCGTTIDAARRLNRRWVGVDISAFAIDLIRERRLQDPTIMTYGIPADLAGARKLAAEQPFAFESWAVTRLPGFAPNMKQQGDGGVDGRATLAVRPDDADSRLALAQVKGGKFTVSYLRDFRHVMTREHAAVGCFTTLEPLPPKHRADVKMDGVVHVGGRPFDRVNLWSVAEYFDERYPLLPVMTDPYSGRPLNQHTLF